MKPIEARRLLETVTRWGVAGTEQADAAFHADRLDANCGGDPAFAREVLGEFVHTSAEALARIAASLERGDRRAVTAESHGLKGASGLVGADAFAAACAEIESSGNGFRQRYVGETRSWPFGNACSSRRRRPWPATSKSISSGFRSSTLSRARVDAFL